MGYQVYPRSFADANCDGVGDLPGLRSKLAHLAWLGVDVVWISPFYPSPGRDHGYDVSDYVGIDPMMGTIEDFDGVIADARQLGLKVFVDIVPNHSSSDHAWFQSALNDPTGPYRDYYIWKDPKPDGSPPNNWVSYFGGPAWTLDPTSEKYWCHLFLPEQPDLNWENEAVRAEFDEVLRFWCERGVDGFRIDVAQGLAKHQSFADNPQLHDPVNPGNPVEVMASFDHQYDLAQPETIDIFRRWRKVVEPYGAVLLGELGVWDPAVFAGYVADNTALEVAFALEPGLLPWEPAKLVHKISQMREHAGTGVAWELSNHDQHRAVSRFGGGESGLRRTLSLMTLMFGLDGMPFLYQGEELGLEDGAVAAGAEADPIALRNPDAPSEGRDVARTAMPWEPGPNNGFTGAPEAWLPARDRTDAETVRVQRDQRFSTLHHYRTLVGLRKEIPGLWNALGTVSNTGLVVRVDRPDTVVLANLGSEAVEIPCDLTASRVCFRSWPMHQTDDVAPAFLEPETTLIFRRDL